MSWWMNNVVHLVNRIISLLIGDKNHKIVRFYVLSFFPLGERGVLVFRVFFFYYSQGERRGFKPHFFSFSRESGVWTVARYYALDLFKV